mgnify:CR=1 FL=1
MAKTVDMGNNETMTIGVVEVPEGFLALTLAESKTFKTFKGAESWLARRGYTAKGERIRKIEVADAPDWSDLADAGWDTNACTFADYQSPRAAALFAALGLSLDDKAYALARHADGRWALFQVESSTPESKRYAYEA